MKTREQIDQLLQYIKGQFAETVVVDEDALYKSYEQTENNHSMAIKILSVFGGILGSLTFIGFLFLAGIYDSGVGMIVTGILLMVASIWLNKEFDTILLDTASISAFLISLVLIGTGMTSLEVNYNITLILFTVISFILILFVHNYIFAFIAALVINGCVLMLLGTNEMFDLIHFWIAGLTALLLMLFLKEEKLLAHFKDHIDLYKPLRIALILSLLFCLYMLTRAGLFPLNASLFWLSSLIMLAGILYTLRPLLHTMDISEKKQQYIVYAAAILLLVPTAPSPSIMGSLLILLLSYHSNYKTGTAIGIISFIYALGQYYYDLHFTLLTKSMLMFTSGLLFLGLYFISHKKLSADEIN